MLKQLLTIFLVLYRLSSIAQHNAETFSKLDVLEGTWMMQTDKVTIAEQWQQQNKNNYAGKSWTIKGKDSNLTETLLLTYDNGVIKYTSTVAGENNGKAISFVLTSAENNTYVFENPQHDFPKRIIYTFISNKELTASIDDGTPNNKIIFNYWRKPA